VDPHLQSHTREHLDLACVKLNNTQVQLDETRAKLNRVTQDQLTIIKESQETKIKFEEKLEALQKQINMLGKITGNSGNTLFDWEITSFLSAFMKREERKTIESDPFYTALFGYKLKVFVDLNYRRGPYMNDPELSIGIRLMEGEYDDILPWPFTLTTTFKALARNMYKTEPMTIVQQLSPTEENLSLPLFSKRPRGGSTADGRVESFLNSYHLQDGVCIINDTLSLQVDVGRPDANLRCSTPGYKGYRLRGYRT